MNNSGELSSGNAYGVRLLAVGAVLGAAAGMAACTPGETPNPQVSASASAEAVPAPAGVCKEPEANDPTRIAKAQRCLQAMHGGKVLLVDFGAQQNVSKDVATHLPAIITDYTAGSVNLTVQTVPASPEAQNAFQATLGSQDCADPNGDTNKYSGAIADKLMPAQTKGADFVLGITGTTSCIPGRSGQASQRSGRYADIYMGTYKEEAAASDPNVRESVARTGTMLTAHELMHLFGLGHSGQIISENTDLGGNGNVLGKPQVNLDKYLQHATYDEYGDYSNVMGTGRQDYIDASHPANKMDIDFLNWPKYATGEAKNPARDLGKEVAEFDIDSTRNREYASIRLKTPIKMATPGHARVGEPSKPANESDDSAVEFTGLAFAPLISENGNYGVEVLLTAGKTIATMGSLNPDIEYPNAKSVVECGGIKVEVRTQGGKTFVRQLSE